MRASSLLTGLAGLIGASTAPGTDTTVARRAGSLTPVPNFGTNPSGIKMFIYVPAKLQPKPPIVLVLHACGWTAGAFFGSTKYGALAEQHGYVAIFGQTPTDGACWDVSSKETLTHGAGGDSLGLASMIDYTLKTYGGDPDRVFVTGESSGAMMTVGVLPFSVAHSVVVAASRSR